MKLRDKLKPLVKGQSFKNFSWNLCVTILYPMLMLLSTPIFISKLGLIQFGIWMLVNSISQTISVLNMGLGDANIKYISGYTATDDYRGINSVVSTTFCLSLVIVAFIIPLGYFIALSVDHFQWFEIDQENRALTLACIKLGSILFSLKFLEIIVLSVFQGFERYDIHSQLSFLSKAIILVANIGWVFFNGNLIFILISSIILQLAFVIIELLYLLYKYKKLHIKLILKRSAIKNVLSFSTWAWFQSLLAILATNVDKFIVAQYSGLATLSYYSLGYMVMTQVHAVFSTSISFIFPKVSKKAAMGESFDKFFNNIQSFTVLIGFAIVTVLIVIEKPIVQLWLGDNATQQALLFIKLFLMTNYFYLINIVPHNFLNGSGFVKKNTLYEFISKLLSLVAMVVMFKIGKQPEYLIWGILTALAISLPYKIHLVRKNILHSKSWWGIDAVIPPIILMGILTVNITLVSILLVPLLVITSYQFYFKKSELLMRASFALFKTEKW